MGALIGCTILTGRAMAPIGQVAALLSRLQGSIVSLSGLNDLIKLPQEREEGRDYVRKPDFEPRIEFSDVTFSYNPESAPAIINASFSIKQGERVAILGRVGSGKSTLLNVIGLLDKPTKGSIEVNQRSLGSLSDKEVAEYRNQTVGFVFQSHHLLPSCSVLENVMVPALAGFGKLGGDELRNRAAELLKDVGLDHRLYWQMNRQVPLTKGTQIIL